jgi:lipoyl(octanoyl) transferase
VSTDGPDNSFAPASTAPAIGDPAVLCLRLGLVPYGEAFELQKQLEAMRWAGEVPDLLLLLEHPPVYTRGRRASDEELPMGEEWYASQGIEVVDSDRGGRVTYHGPGQLVGYPVMSLRPYRDDVHDYVCRLEQTMIATLAAYGVGAGPLEGLTGVWTSERRKIGSIGVHVNRGTTTHGFAINVNNDLQPFEWIVPCGMEHCRMSSVARETGAEQEMDGFMDVVCREFGRAYGRRPLAARLGDLPLAAEAVGA